MNVFNLNEFTKGWFIGNFNPSLHLNPDFEVAVKFSRMGETEASHKQLVAFEITVVIDGTVRIGTQILEKGHIAVVAPGETVDFESLTDSSLVCVKFPSIPHDKVIVS